MWLVKRFVWCGIVLRLQLERLFYSHFQFRSIYLGILDKLQSNREWIPKMTKKNKIKSNNAQIQWQTIFSLAFVQTICCISRSVTKSWLVRSCLRVKPVENCKHDKSATHVQHKIVISIVVPECLLGRLNSLPHQKRDRKREIERESPHCHWTGGKNSNSY